MKFKRPLKITSRTSSVTNGFVQAIIPQIAPTERELREWYRVLRIDPNSPTCVYCGPPSTDADHLRPLVKNKRPTGYIHEIRNLVPCCGPCNQSKGGADWRKWMMGTARGSPKSKGVPDIDARISILEEFEQWGGVTPLHLDQLVGEEEWARFWTLRDEIVAAMHSAQKVADSVREKLTSSGKRLR